MTKCPGTGRAEDCPDCAELPECCAPVPTIIEVAKMPEPTTVYRYTVVTAHDILDEMEYTVDFGEGDFWYFYNSVSDKTLRVKTADIRYIEFTPVEETP